MADTHLLADPTYRVPSFVEYAEFALLTESPPATVASQIVWSGDMMVAMASLSTFTPVEGTPGQYVAGHLNLGLIRLCHAVIGFCTESAEILLAWAAKRHRDKKLDLINVKEEMGDALCYVPIALQVLGIDFSWVDAQIKVLRGSKAWKGDKAGELVDGLPIRAGHLLEIAVKKRLFYPRAIDESACLQAVGEFVDVLLRLCFVLGFDPYDVMTANARKLLGPGGRYEGRFDTARALDRDVASEMAQVAIESQPGQYDDADVVDPETGRISPTLTKDRWVSARDYAQANPGALFYPGYGFRYTEGNDL